MEIKPAFQDSKSSLENRMNSTINKALDTAKTAGIEEGVETARIIIVCNMLAENIDDETISRVTTVSLEQISAIKQNSPHHLKTIMNACLNLSRV